MVKYKRRKYKDDDRSFDGLTIGDSIRIEREAKDVIFKLHQKRLSESMKRSWAIRKGKGGVN